MNNIEILAKQAFDTVGADDAEWFRSYSEKFVELIITECDTIINSTIKEYFATRRQTDDFSLKNQYAEGEISARAIKLKLHKHFGVE